MIKNKLGLFLISITMIFSLIACTLGDRVVNESSNYNKIIKSKLTKAEKDILEVFNVDLGNIFVFEFELRDSGQEQKEAMIYLDNYEDGQKIRNSKSKVVISDKSRVIFSIQDRLDNKRELIIANLAEGEKFYSTIEISKGFDIVDSFMVELEEHRIISNQKITLLTLVQNEDDREVNFDIDNAGQPSQELLNNDYLYLLSFKLEE